jgi:hypothetical protein
MMGMKELQNCILLNDLNKEIVNKLVAVHECRVTQIHPRFAYVSHLPLRREAKFRLQSELFVPSARLSSLVERPFKRTDLNLQTYAA